MQSSWLSLLRSVGLLHPACLGLRRVAAAYQNVRPCCRKAFSKDASGNQRTQIKDLSVTRKVVSLVLKLTRAFLKAQSRNLTGWNLLIRMTFLVFIPKSLSCVTKAASKKYFISGIFFRWKIQPVDKHVFLASGFSPESYSREQGYLAPEISRS